MYVVDDVVWAGSFYEERRICIQAHTGAGGDKDPLLAGSDYWKLYQPIVQISDLNDGKVILDWIKANGWVKHATFKSGTAASPTYNERKKIFETYTWVSTRSTCTTLAQEVWDLARTGDPETTEIDAPHIRILNRRYNSPPPDPYWDEGPGAWNCKRVFDVGKMGDSSNWNSDLKQSGCSYYIRFETHDISDPDYGSVGVLETPILFDGASIGSIGSSSKLMVSEMLSFVYADWDFINDETDIRFDDASWPSLFVPPDLWDAIPDDWDDASVDYYVDNQVAHSGSYWVCIQAHTSSSATEPGTSGGEPYWKLMANYGWQESPWHGGYSTYRWTCQKIECFFIRPDYQDW